MRPILIRRTPTTEMRNCDDCGRSFEAPPHHARRTVCNPCDWRRLDQARRACGLTHRAVRLPELGELDD
jgi:anaerobic ribonucleoside-triphosphate reductase